MLGTYYRFQMDKKNGKDNNWDDLKPDNPDLVHPGKSYYIPAFPNGSWESNRSLLASVKDIWRDAYKSYGSIKTHKDEAKIWRAMYYYLGGVEELPDL